MIAANPYYITNYRECRCTWTVCQCWSHQQQAYYPTYHWAVEPPSKVLLAKQRLESLRFKSDIRPRPRVRLPMPSVRPRLQALSMRIR
jgi:hypothetical protein